MFGSLKYMITSARQDTDHSNSEIGLKSIKEVPAQRIESFSMESGEMSKHVQLGQSNVSSSVDDPAWKEVVKRYRDIVERENKFLRSFPAHHGGQVSPLAAHAAQAKKALSIPGGDISIKRPRPWPPSEEVTHACGVPVEHVCKGASEKIGDRCLPKILAVFSLDSSNPGNMVIESRSRKITPSLNPIKDNTSRRGAQHGLLSCKKSCVAVNVIDLTVDDDDETNCRLDEKARSSAVQEACVDDGKQIQQSPPCKSMVDKGNEPCNTRFSRRKRKAVVVQKRKISSTGDPLKRLCISKSSRNEDYKKSGTVTDLSDSKLIEKGDKEAVNIIDHNEIYQQGSIENESNSPRMKNRERKIMDLKVRLAQQNDKLARLKALGDFGTVLGNNQEERCHSARDKLQQKENHTGELAIKPVNLEDICQHVLKSFDIINSRKLNINESLPETVPSGANNVSDGCPLKSITEQDEFLFQLGLGRRIAELR
ncbi:uncharacterized protein [Acropora muricata]|uniref:uncharacterized protein isoform X1 n=1 Tax=Acropora muricata TaxID=159855 RepID=UPI0034E39338